MYMHVHWINSLSLSLNNLSFFCLELEAAPAIEQLEKEEFYDTRVSLFEVNNHLFKAGK